MNNNVIKSTERKKDIAIIGMSGKFPKSDTIEALWNNLVNGKELVHFYKNEELVIMGVAPVLMSDPSFVKCRSLIDDPGSFDYSFFGYTKEEALVMDPQTRVMHEQIWSALEDAGCNPDDYNEKIGMYLSASDNLNWRAHIILNPQSNVSGFMTARLSDKSFMATLISYSLNLKGPSFYINTGCSSSMTALHLACRSLLLRECSIALSGAVNINTAIEYGYMYEDDLIFSKDGHSRVFDEKSSGTIFGDGVGVVVLKRFEDAVKDRDDIYAVIRSTAVNNDGKRKVGYTAPSVNGQADCIRLAHKVAGVEPESITYIEAHGTATKLGDPVEIEALNKAFNNNTNHRCAIGSIKSNLGHLDTAAGIAGVIKTALSLKHKLLIPSINFVTANPGINFNAGPFYVNKSLQPWKGADDQVLRAGVSSFGIGGTNGHAVLEEAPSYDGRALPQNKHHLLIFSARSQKALKDYLVRIQHFLNNNGPEILSDLATTLQIGRRHFPVRSFLVSENLEGVKNALAKINATSVESVTNKGARNTVFMFSGGGSQYFGMARQLYVQEIFFKEIMDQGFLLLKQKTGKDFKAIVGYSDEPAENTNAINSIDNMLPTLFLVEYAVARTLMKMGIQPQYMIGHSLGEYVAACISGVFSFEDALELVIQRGLLTMDLPEGGMIGVELSSEEVRKYLTDKLSIATINMDDSCVVSGAKVDINTFIKRLNDDNVNFTELKISIAAHSLMLDPILNDYRKALEKVKFGTLQIPFISNISGKEITENEATSVDYWVKHLRHTVNFLSGISYLLQHTSANYIEIGSGGALTSFLKQNRFYKDEIFGINILRHPREIINDHEYYLTCLARMWQHGVKIDWHEHQSEKFRKVHAPGYVFDKTDLQVKVNPIAQMVAGGLKANLKRKDIYGALHFTSWKKSLPVLNAKNAEYSKQYLIFSDGENSIEALKKELARDSQILEVRAGVDYHEAPAFTSLDVLNHEHFERLFHSLDERGIAVEHVVYAWRINSTADVLKPCIPIMYLCQLLAVNHGNSLKKFTFLTSQASRILGNEVVEPAVSLAKKTAQMILAGNSSAFLSFIDIDASDRTNDMTALLSNEARHNFVDSDIAFRNKQRWTAIVENVSTSHHLELSSISANKSYLIVNGFCRVGLVLGAYLVRQHGAKVLVTGIEKLKESNSYTDSDIRFWNHLKESSPGRLHYHQVDTQDLNALQSLLQEVDPTQVGLGGVIFIPQENEVTDLSDLGNLMKVQARKLNGFCNVHELLAQYELDFRWSPLKLSSYLGRVHENIFFDTYADAFRDATGPTGNSQWTLVNLDDVREENISEEEIVKAFEISLSHGINSLIMSFNDMDTIKNNTAASKNLKENTNILEYQSTEIDEGYTAPVTKLEIELCALWQSFVIARRIGVDDHFFELGGNSLKAMTMLKRIHQQYNVQVSLKDFFSKATVRMLAEEINISTLLKTQKNKSQVRLLKI